MALERLKQTLHAALRHSARISTNVSAVEEEDPHLTQEEGRRFRPRRDASQFDVQRAAAEFKINWIYSDRHTYAIPSSKGAGTHLFLFHKNLSVTDITNAELFQLVRLHTRLSHDDGRITNITPDFLDDAQYTKCIENLILPFAFNDNLISQSDYDSYIEKIAQEVSVIHSDFLLETVVFDRLFNSLLLHIPRSLGIDIDSVVSESGYIHSAGHSIYARKAEKADRNEIEANIEEFLSSSPGIKYDFVPFSEASFNLHEDIDFSSSPKNGIDGNPFEFDKQYIGESQISDLLEVIKFHFSDRVNVQMDEMPDQVGIDDKSSLVFLLYDNKFTKTS